MSDTARAQIQPKIIQLSVFLPNRVGLLLRLTKQLETQKVHICAMSIVDTADSAIVRLIVDKVAEAKQVFREAGLTCYESELLGIELPIHGGIGLSSILGVLLRAEININYVYALIPRSNENPVLALHVDNHETAIHILRRHDLTLIGQSDVTWEGEGS